MTVAASVKRSKGANWPRGLLAWEDFSSEFLPSAAVEAHIVLLNNGPRSVVRNTTSPAMERQTLRARDLGAVTEQISGFEIEYWHWQWLLWDWGLALSVKFSPARITAPCQTYAMPGLLAVHE
ncbi:hypothetical protein BaRGS_00036806 [Batillaria attramentaria]|uniref:Uncharacterized protein n=1 Tax=Batillaria attramentaria TaxID=370345 RepID=A0ABD0JAF0_9CAEN